MNAKDYARNQARRAERTEREVAKRAAAFAKLTTGEILNRLSGRGATPWERTALRRVLATRPNPNVAAALERDRQDVWSARYAEALGTGFSDGDARLHADQARDLFDRTHETPAED